jgi:hypothetical protein
MITMINNNFRLEFIKTLRVLNSCVNNDQLNVAEKYMKLFIKKWKNNMNEQSINSLYDYFYKIINNKNEP